jgi:hypothetical protein
MSLSTATTEPSVNGLPLLDYLADNQVKSQLVMNTLGFAVATFELEKGRKIVDPLTTRRMHRIIALGVHEGEYNPVHLIDMAMEPYRVAAEDQNLGIIAVDVVKKRKPKSRQREGFVDPGDLIQ